MEMESVKLWAMMGTIAVGTIAPALAMGMIASRALDSIGRNPETENAIRTTMVLGIAFVESIAIFALVVALIIKFV
ncbi:ATP synthase F0 subunit C [soil metagenome]